ncbi:hypothetical protein SEEPB585_19894, partial [Salmonella enterica subsp. enterica serovar Paratyphi B str. ATCC BAA-1585]
DFQLRLQIFGNERFYAEARRQMKERKEHTEVCD